MTAIRLQDAYLCLDCDTINDNSAACTQCGKTLALYSLAKFVNRESRFFGSLTLAALGVALGLLGTVCIAIGTYTEDFGDILVEVASGWSAQ
jgi:hypothetical protein